MWLINKLSRPTKRQLLIYQPLNPPHHHDHSRHARLHEQYLNRVLSGHDGVMIWKRFLHCKTFVRRAHRSPVELPSNGPVTRNFDVFLVQAIKQPVQQSVDLPVIWGSNTLLWRHCISRNRRHRMPMESYCQATGMPTQWDSFTFKLGDCW